MIDSTANAAEITIGDGNAFAGSTDYIQNLSSQAFDLSGYTNTTFGGPFNAATATVDAGTLASFYAVEDKIVDYLDNAADGYVRIAAGYDFVAHSSETAAAGAIQRGVNAANTDEAVVPADGNTVEVQAGTYVANGYYTDAAAGVVSELNIDKPLTLLGPNATFDPNSGLTPANAQAVIIPGNSDPDPYDSTAIVIVGVNASNVTIQGFTIDGDNPALASDSHTVTYNGVPIAASEGIASYQDVGNITISNNIVRNTAYDGVDFQNGPSFSGAPTTNNVITQNLIENLGGGGFGFGVGVILYDNFYAAVTDNVIDTVRVGRPDR